MSQTIVFFILGLMKEDIFVEFHPAGFGKSGFTVTLRHKRPGQTLSVNQDFIDGSFEEKESEVYRVMQDMYNHLKSVMNE